MCNHLVNAFLLCISFCCDICKSRKPTSGFAIRNQRLYLFLFFYGNKRSHLKNFFLYGFLKSLHRHLVHMQEVVKYLMNQFIGLTNRQVVFADKNARISFLLTDLCQCLYFTGKNSTLINNFITHKAISSVHSDVTVYQSKILNGRQIVDNRFRTSCGDKNLNSFFVSGNQRLDSRDRDSVRIKTH